MAAVSDLNQWETEAGRGVDGARVALGVVMATTVAVVALVVQVGGPALAAKAAAAMLPVLTLFMLRAPLDDCSIYSHLAHR
jgi:hypothetical protein